MTKKLLYVNSNFTRHGFTSIEALFGLLIFLIFGVGSLEMIKFTAGNSMISRVSALRDGVFSQLNQDLRIPSYLAASMNHPNNLELLRCVTGKNQGTVVEDGCNANTTYPFTMLVNNTVVAAGPNQNTFPLLYALNGQICTAAPETCPLRAVTTFTPYCANGTAICTRADKVAVSLTVEVNPLHPQIAVRPTTEQITLDIGAFSGGNCPPGRINRGYRANGLVDCWVWQLGSNKPSASGATYRDDEGLSITVDAAGNIYYGGVTYGSFAGHTNSSGDPEIFVGMMDGFGVTKWTNQFSVGTSGDLGSIAFNLADSSIYITGKGNFSSDGKKKGKSGQSDAFVMKLDTQGNEIWTYSMGGKMGSMGKALTFDSVGNAVAAYVSGENKAANMAWGLADFYIEKVDPSGDKVWELQVGAQKDSSRMVRVVTDLNDNTFILGSTDVNNNATQNDTYVAKISEAGVLSGQQTYSFTNNEELPQDLVVNSTTGEVLVGGQTRASTSSNWEIFILKFNAADITLPPTTKTITFPGNNYLRKMSIDNGKIFLAVETDGALPGYQNQGGLDAYVAQLDSNLNVVWTKQTGTAGDDTIADVVTRTVNGMIFTYIVGSTNNSFSTWLNEAPSRDLFFAKFENNGR